MRIIGPEIDGTWLVSVSREEMRKIDPSTDKEWAVTFSERVAKLALSKRAKRPLLRTLRMSNVDTDFILCFKKDGSALDFDEWASQPDLVSRLECLRQIGRSTAAEIAGEARKSLADRVRNMYDCEIVGEVSVVEV